jgi:hypothetical protein
VVLHFRGECRAFALCKPEVYTPTEGRGGHMTPTETETINIILKTVSLFNPINREDKPFLHFPKHTLIKQAVCLHPSGGVGVGL